MNPIQLSASRHPLSYHRSLCIPIVCAGLLVGTAQLSAQQAVHPPHFTNAEATWYSAAPFGRSSLPLRMLQVHDGVAPGTLRELAFRLNEGQAATPAFAAVAELQLSTALTVAATTNATFDANHGVDRTTVIPSMVIQFPATSASPSPRPFEFGLVFQQPFVFQGGGSLCFDLRVTNRSTTNTFYFDDSQNASNPSPTINPFGTGCLVPGANQPISLSATGSTSWTTGAALIRYSGSHMPANAIVALSVGTSTTQYGPLPLPFELPGSATAASGRCMIYNDSVVQVPVFTAANGSLVSGTNLSFAINASMNGLSAFTQVLAFDAAANPFGISTSNTVQFHMTAPVSNNPVSSVYAESLLGATGSRSLANGLVVRIGY